MAMSRFCSNWKLKWRWSICLSLQVLWCTVAFDLFAQIVQQLCFQFHLRQISWNEESKTKHIFWRSLIHCFMFVIRTKSVSPHNLMCHLIWWYLFYILTQTKISFAHVFPMVQTHFELASRKILEKLWIWFDPTTTFTFFVYWLVDY